MCVEIHANIGMGNSVSSKFYLFIFHDHHDHGAMRCSTAMD